jgi:RimJ/RimL family protein N-acetyltransferase
MSIALELLGPEHIPAIEELIRDPDVLRFTRVPDPPPSGFAETWCSRYAEGRKDGTREGFAIVDGEGTFLGLALAPTIERTARTVELGYVVAPAGRGRGVATEALRQLTAWAFTALGARRIELFISVDNAPSKRVAERAGYIKEGVLRGSYFKQGIWEDGEIWSRLPTDPAPE